MAPTLRKRRTVILLCCWIAVIAILTALSQWSYMPVRYRAKLFRTRFIFIIETVLLIANRYIWHHAFGSRVRDNCDNTNASVADVARPRTRFLQLLLLVFMTCAQLSYTTNLWSIDTNPHTFSLLCYVCLATLLNVSTGLLLLNFIAYTVTGCVKPISLRSWKKHHRLILSFIYGVAMTLVGFYNVSIPPTVKQVHVPIRNLPQSMDNMHLVQISDIHLGPTVGQHRLQEIVEIVNSLRPDVIALTGDLVDGSVSALKYAAAPLKELEPKYSKYFVTGNHEYYTGDVDNWMKYMKQLGFIVLHNKHATVQSHERPDDYFYVAGTDDIKADTIGYDGHGMRLDLTLKSCTDGHPVILLAHQPTAAKKALDSPLSTNIELVLSGHTHGGQMFPFTLAVYFINPFFRGLYTYKGKHVYVNEGTQFWGFPVRLGSSMEITDIVLESTPA